MVSFHTPWWYDDVDKDTFILTEVSTGSDEDTFRVFAQGVNNLSLDKDKLTIRTAKLFDVASTRAINGTVGQDTLDVQERVHHYSRLEVVRTLR